MKKWHSTRKEIWKILIQIFEVSIKYFAENGEEKFFPDDSSFTSNFKNAKNSILPWQSKFSKFLQTHSFHVSLLKGICHHTENDKHWKKKFGHF